MEPTTTNSEVAIIVGAVSSILAFLGVVANMINTNFKEARARRWAQEDKEQLAQTTRHTVRETGQAIGLQFDEQRKLLEDLVRNGEERLRTIVGKIDENTQVSKEAFKEANGVNAKIASLGLQMREKPAEPQDVVIVNEKPINVHST